MINLHRRRNSLGQLVNEIRSGKLSVIDVAQEVIRNQQAQVLCGNKNSYTQFSQERILQQAFRLDHFLRRKRAPAIDSFPPLFGLPFSIKDIFHQRGWFTTAGSSFLAKAEGIQQGDSEIVSRCRTNGVLFTGKTHLNEFAYGLTGENRTWGACRNPEHPERLVGGSSSGAAASVIAGTAAVGVGTDTGGSIRVPSALNGLVGVRLSPCVATGRGMIPLAPSFDTVGWIQRHLADVPLVYSTLFRTRISGRSKWSRKKPLRLLFFKGPWLASCLPDIQMAYTQLAKTLRGFGARVRTTSGDFLLDSALLFGPIQAHEAARYHRRWLPEFGHLYDPVIRSRLEWGENISTEEYFTLQADRRRFISQMNHLFQANHILVAPACPFTELKFGEDHNCHRMALLQITTPFSLAGCPALTIPDISFSGRLTSSRIELRAGWQFIAPPGQEKQLMRLAVWLASAGTDTALDKVKSA